MNKERVKKLAANPRFISGIYNYCDRWCERCPFTSRCMTYAMEKEDERDPKSRDINNKEFWNKLHETFRVTMELLEESAKERGIDLNALATDDEEEFKQHRRRRREQADKHPLARASHAYITMIDNWFKAAKPQFEEKEIELNTKARLELKDANPESEVAGIIDTVEVVRWYQFFIHVKLMRSIQGAAEPRPDILKDFPKDSDGSAKIALIAMDRSIAAWGELRNHFPEKTDSILDMLVHLQRLRAKAEEAFPDARAFVRPGFDTLGKKGVKREAGSVKCET